MNMNIDTRKPVTGRLADLSPFDIDVILKSPALKPHEGAVPSKRSTTHPESDPQFGCVDWYLWEKSKVRK
jgi:hypothetical protein